MSFREFDEQQIIESIPHLQKFDHLEQISFHSALTDSVVAELNRALPELKLVDQQGRQIP